MVVDIRSQKWKRQVMKKTKFNPVVVCDPETLTRAEWLKMRRNGLGGSDAGVALGCNPWSSPLLLYLEKKKGVSMNVSGPAIDAGNMLESLVIDQTKTLRPDYVRHTNSLPMMQHPEHEFMLATPDAGAYGTKHGEGLIEAKTALSFYGAASWNEGIPAQYRAQCVHYMAVTGRPWCIIVCFAAGPRWHHHLILREEDEVQELIEAEKKLWAAICEDDFDFLIDGSDATKNALNMMHEAADEELPDLDLRENERAQKMLCQYLKMKDWEKAINEDKKESENALKKMLGDHETAWCDGYRINWKNTARGRRFTVKKG